MREQTNPAVAPPDGQRKRNPVAHSVKAIDYSLGKDGATAEAKARDRVPHSLLTSRQWSESAGCGRELDKLRNGRGSVHRGSAPPGQGHRRNPPGWPGSVCSGGRSMLCSEPLAAHRYVTIDARNGEAGIITRGIVQVPAEAFQGLAKKLITSAIRVPGPQVAQPRGEGPRWGKDESRARGWGARLGVGPVRNGGRPTANRAALTFGLLAGAGAVGATGTGLLPGCAMPF